MLPSHRPRSAPGPSGDVRPAVSHSRETLSTNWNPRQGSYNNRHEHSSSGSSRNDRRTPEELLGDTDPWARKTLLCLDGGGVRGYSSLLILRALMIRIAEIEKEDNPRSTNSVHPLLPRPRKPVRVKPTGTDTIRRNGSPEAIVSNPRSLSADYLPAHYFDYLAGTSTGG